jgi:hypothetical protein
MTNSHFILLTHFPENIVPDFSVRCIFLGNVRVPTGGGLTNSYRILPERIITSFLIVPAAAGSTVCEKPFSS